MKDLILVINPGSTSTKTAVFKGTVNFKQISLTHSQEELDEFEKITDEYEYRKNAILNWLKEEGISQGDIQAVIGRGGLLRPMPSGTYKVTEAMIEDLRIGIQGEHASNLGGIIARAIADENGVEAYIADPVAVDEFEDIARISGLPEIERKSLVHALNIRAVSRRVAASMGKSLEEVNLITAHLGGGISIAPLKMGRIVDVNNSNDGGPFTPERCGTLPVCELIKLAYSGRYSYKELKNKLTKKGGLLAYLGTKDAREVEKMILEGNEHAGLIYDAMAYQIAKDIGASATVLYGNVDKIILTGGLAYSKMLMNKIAERVKFIAPVEIVPGEDEMQALAEAAERVLTGQEIPKMYENECL